MCFLHAISYDVDNGTKHWLCQMDWFNRFKFRQKILFSLNNFLVVGEKVDCHVFDGDDIQIPHFPFSDPCVNIRRNTL